MRSAILALTLALAAAPLLAPAAHAQQELQAVILTHDRDTELALSAAPEDLRADATVYVFTEFGYALAKQGTNGVTCLTNRDSFFYGEVTLRPTCWDAAGEDSYVRVILDVGSMLAHGEQYSDIIRSVDERFESGTYHAPAGDGVAWMLAGDLRVSASGEVLEQVFPPHVMLYAPDATQEILGYDRAAWEADPDSRPLFTAGAGGPHLGYRIAAPDAAALPHRN